MARRQVDLHVRAFADRSVEYALRQPSAPHARSCSWIVCALLAASAMLWSAWTWRAAGVSSAVVALLVNRVSGAAVVEGVDRCVWRYFLHECVVLTAPVARVTAGGAVAGGEAGHEAAERRIVRQGEQKEARAMQ